MNHILCRLPFTYIFVLFSYFLFLLISSFLFFFFSLFFFKKKKRRKKKKGKEGKEGGKRKRKEKKKKNLSHFIGEILPLYLQILPNATAFKSFVKKQKEIEYFLARKNDKLPVLFRKWRFNL